jgi:hypothetical protein
MKKADVQDSNKVLDLIKKITIEVENARPSRERMIEDIKMMNFKIRPLVGDVFELVRREVGFLESLWKIGKIEEIVAGGIAELNDREKEIFLQYLEDFQKQMERRISSVIKQLPPEASKNMSVLELEVFREKKGYKKNLN